VSRRLTAASLAAFVWAMDLFGRASEQCDRATWRDVRVALPTTFDSGHLGFSNAGGFTREHALHALHALHAD